MIIRTAHSLICSFSPSYIKLDVAVSNFLYRKVVLRLPEAVSKTADKLFYLFENALPDLAFLGLSIKAGFLAGMTLSTMYWVVPTAIYIVYELVDSMRYYPYNFLENINQDVVRQRLPEVVQRPQIIKNMHTYLAQPDSNNVLIVGPAGSGKTTLVNAFAQYIESAECPADLKGTQILRLRLDKLRSEASQSGAIEKRLLMILTALRLRGHMKKVVFIDEVHQLTENRGKLANLLKPFLAQGLRCIGATTDHEYHKFFKKDEGLDRRFNKIDLPELGLSSAARAVQSNFKGNTVSGEVAHYAISKAAEVLPQFALPDSAIKLVKNTLAFLQTQRKKKSHTLTKQDIDESIRTLEIAAPLKKPSNRLQPTLDKLAQAVERLAAKVGGPTPQVINLI